MSAYMENDDGPVFIFQEDEEAKQSSTRLFDLAVGDRFIFNGKLFTKKNNMGLLYGVLNIQEDDGRMSHLDPRTYISVLH